MNGQLERLWAGWRTAYVTGAASDVAADAGDGDCVFCGIVASGLSDRDAYIVWRGEQTFALLNAYPYTTGHLMIMPIRHIPDLEDLTAGESNELWHALQRCVKALKSAYRPDGINVGANLGRAAGAGVPGHFHVHVLPRWQGDSNFMTSVANTRVLPEALSATWERLTGSLPS